MDEFEKNKRIPGFGQKPQALRSEYASGGVETATVFSSSSTANP